MQSRLSILPACGWQGSHCPIAVDSMALFANVRRLLGCSLTTPYVPPLLQATKRRWPR